MANQDYYKILQIDPDAEQEIVQAAYKRLALKYHPDTSESIETNRRMQEINEAYEVISDPIKRAGFDRQRREQVSAPSRDEQADIQRRIYLKQEIARLNHEIQTLNDLLSGKAAQADIYKIMGVIVLLCGLLGVLLSCSVALNDAESTIVGCVTVAPSLTLALLGYALLRAAHQVDLNKKKKHSLEQSLSTLQAEQEKYR
jgi:curved DNA-binding protein CbpA